MMKHLPALCCCLVAVVTIIKVWEQLQQPGEWREQCSYINGSTHLLDCQKFTQRYDRRVPMHRQLAYYLVKFVVGTYDCSYTVKHHLQDMAAYSSVKYRDNIQPVIHLIKSPEWKGITDQRMKVFVQEVFKAADRVRTSIPLTIYNMSQHLSYAIMESHMRQLKLDSISVFLKTITHCQYVYNTTMVHAESLYNTTMVHAESLYTTTMVHAESLYTTTMVHAESLYITSIEQLPVAVDFMHGLGVVSNGVTMDLLAVTVRVLADMIEWMMYEECVDDSWLAWLGYPAPCKRLRVSKYINYMGEVSNAWFKTPCRPCQPVVIMFPCWMYT